LGPAGKTGRKFWFYARDLTLQTDYKENQKKQVFFKNNGWGDSTNPVGNLLWKNAGKTVPVPSGKNGEGLL
jgi:hypothetical protein